jgi:hypothetical protein
MAQINTQPTVAQDNRIGYAFNKPIDSTSKWWNYHAPAWGVLVSPDEQRYVTLFGNKLQAQSTASSITDEVLMYYESNAIGIIERDFNINILKRVVIASDPVDVKTGLTINRFDPTTYSVKDWAVPQVAMDYYNLMTVDQKQDLVIREQGYPYRRNLSEKYLFTELKFRPVPNDGILTAFLVDPIIGTLINLMQFRKLRPGLSAQLQFFPSIINASSYIPAISHGLTRFQYPFEDFPDAIRIDYIVGYPTASAVPKDLREMVRMLSGIMLMADYGDGKIDLLTGGSLSFSSISESFSTPKSSSSMVFQARIDHFKKELDRLYKQNQPKYSRAVVGFV